MLELDFINGWMNYKSPTNPANDRNNICPAFWVDNIVYSLDREEVEDQLWVQVNDHGFRYLQFSLNFSDIVDHQQLPKILAKKGFLGFSNYEKAISNHLINEQQRCVADGKIEYRHHRLGWYEYNGQNHFLMDSNFIAGTTSTCERKNFKFYKGNREDYENFLRNNVYPVPTLALAMAIGYSASVVSLLRDEYDFGTIVYNLCGASSTGKSTVSQLLISPFACPQITNQSGLIRTFSNTDNALFSGLNDIHGLPIVLDDSTTNTKIDYASLIYNLAQGENKGRCDSSGNLREQGSGWSGVVVVSSETPIQSQSCHNQGLQARVIGTEGITWTPDANTSNLIKKTIKKHYGWTGREFAEFVASKPFSALCKHFDDALELVESMMVERDNLSDRLALKYATIPLTISLMNECFGLSLDSKYITALLLDSEQRSVLDRDIAVKALECIKSFVVMKHRNFHIFHYYDSGRVCCRDCVSDRYGRVNFRGNMCEIIIMSSKFNDVLKSSGINEPTTVKKRWKEQGLIKTDKDRYDVKVDGIRSICIVLPEGLPALELIDTDKEGAQ